MRYIGNYEFAEIGFRVSIVAADGHLFIETFGQPPERLYAMGEHRFRIAIGKDAIVRFRGFG